jgi:hypothetical protein
MNGRLGEIVSWLALSRCRLWPPGADRNIAAPRAPSASNAQVPAKMESGYLVIRL